MSIETKIIDGTGSRVKTRVTNRGQLVVGAISFSEAKSIVLDAVDTPVNIYGPKTGENFIITDIIIRGNKTISNTVDAVLSIYESTVGPLNSTQSKVILGTVIPRSGDLVLNGLNLEVSEGVWINATTSDVSILITIMGYYVCVC
jgi:hypothetical protein